MQWWTEGYSWNDIYTLETGAAHEAKGGGKWDNLAGKRIIDFDKENGSLFLIFGDPEATPDYWGDDWNDSPYEHNAGMVYDRYAEGYAEIIVPSRAEAFEPADTRAYDYNSPWCKDDMKKRRVPCLVIKPTPEYKFDEDDFTRALAAEDAIRIYFGDDVIDTLVRAEDAGCHVAAIRLLNKTEQ